MRKLTVISVIVVGALLYLNYNSISSRRNRISKKLDLIGETDLRNWALNTIESGSPQKGDVLDLINNNLSRHYRIINDSSEHKDFRHVIIILGGGHYHVTVRIGNEKFTPYYASNYHYFPWRPGVWIEIEK